MNLRLSIQLRRAGIVFSAVVFAMVIFELFFRVTGLVPVKKFYDDPVTGLILYQPNLHYTANAECFSNDVRINWYGIPGKYYPHEKAPGVFRILVIGNSFVEAEQVPISDTFSQRLERELNARSSSTKFEVVSIGFASHGTYANALYLHKLGWSFAPDVVVDLYIGGDYEKSAPGGTFSPIITADGLADLNPPAKVVSPLKRTVRNILRNSRLFIKLNERWVMANLEARSWFRAAPTVNVEAGITSAELAELWTQEGRSFQAMQADAASRHVPLLVVSWMRSDNVMNVSAGEQVRQLQAISNKYGISYQDLTASVSAQAASAKTPSVFTCDDHWNREGHARFAQSLREVLEAKKLFPR